MAVRKKKVQIVAEKKAEKKIATARKHAEFVQGLPAWCMCKEEVITSKVMLALYEHEKVPVFECCRRHLDLSAQFYKSSRPEIYQPVPIMPKTLFFNYELHGIRVGSKPSLMMRSNPVIEVQGQHKFVSQAALQTVSENDLASLLLSNTRADMLHAGAKRSPALKFAKRRFNPVIRGQTMNTDQISYMAQLGHSINIQENTDVPAGSAHVFHRYVQSVLQAD